jgi:hypothetical protein
VPTKLIAASTTTARQLAEKALRSIPAKEKELIPPYLREFDDVFAKESFDSLPERRTWDHVIELEPGTKPSACKVYPLAPSEQLQLDEFLQENLRTGRIRPSKSPMASPVFFIKKKDGSLRLLLDYRVLNAMTVKNRFPLPIISASFGERNTSPSSMFVGASTMFESRRVTSGRQPFVPIAASTNHS